jgi:hypothetical protein
MTSGIIIGLQKGAGIRSLRAHQSHERDSDRAPCPAALLGTYYSALHRPLGELGPSLLGAPNFKL